MPGSFRDRLTLKAVGIILYVVDFGMKNAVWCIFDQKDGHVVHQAAYEALQRRWVPGTKVQYYMVADALEDVADTLRFDDIDAAIRNIPSNIRKREFAGASVKVAIGTGLDIGAKAIKAMPKFRKRLLVEREAFVLELMAEQPALAQTFSIAKTHPKLARFVTAYAMHKLGLNAADDGGREQPAGENNEEVLAPIVPVEDELPPSSVME